jgi:hypothetical protein
MFTDHEKQEIEEFKIAFEMLQSQAESDLGSVEDAVDELNRTIGAYNDLVEDFKKLVGDICSRFRGDDDDGFAEIVNDTAGYLDSAEDIELPKFLDCFGDDLKEAIAEIEALANAPKFEFETA